MTWVDVLVDVLAGVGGLGLMIIAMLLFDDWKQNRWRKFNRRVKNIIDVHLEHEYKVKRKLKP